MLGSPPMNLPDPVRGAKTAPVGIGAPTMAMPAPTRGRQKEANVGVGSPTMAIPAPARGRPKEIAPGVGAMPMPMPDGPADVWEEGGITDFTSGLMLDDAGPSVGVGGFSQLDNFLYTTSGRLKTRDALVPAPFLDSTGDTLVGYGVTLATIFAGCTGGNKPRDLIVVGDGYDDDIVMAIEDYTESDTLLYKYNLSGDGRTAWDSIADYTGRCELVEFMQGATREIIACTDQYLPIRYSTDGTGVGEVGLTIPSKSTNVLLQATVDDSSTKAKDSGRGISKSGIYYYKFTAWYESADYTIHGESAMQATPYRVEVILADERPFKVDIFRIWDTEFFTGTGVDKYYVYRSPPNQINGPYKQVGSIDTSLDDDEYGTAFTDTTPNGQEGKEGPIGFNAPVKLKHPVVANGRLWGFDVDIPNKLVWSEEGSIDSFPALNLKYLHNNGTGIKEFRRNLYVFTAFDVYVNEGADPKNGLFRISERGTVAHKSIADVGDGLMWVGRGNIYWANFAQYYKDGDFPFPVGNAIKSVFKDIPYTRLSQAVGIGHDDKYYVSLPDYSSSSNRATYVYDLNDKVKAWTKLDFGCVVMGNFGNELLLSVLETWDNGGTTSSIYNLYLTDRDRANDSRVTLRGGTSPNFTLGAQDVDIAVALKTKPSIFGNEFSDVIVRSMNLICFTETDEIVVTTIMDNANTTSITFDTNYLNSAFALSDDSLLFEDSSDLITNGTMEADSNWTSHGTPSTNERSNTQAYAGTYSRKFIVDAENEGIYSDTYTVTAGTYTVTLAIYPSVTTATILPYDGNGDALTAISLTGLTENAWNYASQDVTILTAGTSAKIAIHSGADTSGTYYVDHVSFLRANAAWGGDSVWAKYSASYFTVHKKLGDGAKGKIAEFTLAAADAGNTEIYKLSAYWRSLNPPA